MEDIQVEREMENVRICSIRLAQLDLACIVPFFSSKPNYSLEELTFHEKKR